MAGEPVGFGNWTELALGGVDDAGVGIDDVKTLGAGRGIAEDGATAFEAFSADDTGNKGAGLAVGDGTSSGPSKSGGGLNVNMIPPSTT